MVTELNRRERVGLFVGLLCAFVLEAGITGLVILFWIFYTTLRRR